jgi:hypothetical protein
MWMRAREWFFQQLDEYARKRYGCFVAEMFPSENHTEYMICLRTVGVTLASSDQYACRYAGIAVADVDAAHGEERLTDSITENLVHSLE